MAFFNNDGLLGFRPSSACFLDYYGLLRYHQGVKSLIDNAIADAINSVTGFDFQIVNQLPATGEKGIIYLVPKSANSSSGGTAIVGTATVGTAIVGDGSSGGNSESSSSSNSVVGTATVGTAVVSNGNSGNNLPIVGQAIVGSTVIGGKDDDIGNDDNIYYEYIYVNDRFEKIGSTEVNLSGYLKESDIASGAQVNTMLTQIFG